VGTRNKLLSLLTHRLMRPAGTSSPGRPSPPPSCSSFLRSLLPPDSADSDQA